MLTYELSRTEGCSLYSQLYRAIKADIESGSISPDEKLPSKRSLADHLGVSVITVEGAFRQLEAEGYIRAEERRGYFACSLPLHSAAHATRASLGSRNSRPSDDPSELQASLTSASSAEAPEAASGMFPYARWAKTMRKVLSDLSETDLLRASEPQGSYVLRQALARYLRGSRGLDIDPSCIVIGSGAQTLYGLLIQLLGRNHIYAIEDPGYTRLAKIYRSNDVQLTTVRLDEAGLKVRELEATGADIVHCMPSHQLPTGITMSIARRHELLDWANVSTNCGVRRYIIEDDYDCEFRMKGMIIPTLQSLDMNECVIYTNTLTKTLGSAFRIGYMLLPPHLTHLFKQDMGFYTCTVGALEQLTLARFIDSGDFERHINRQRTHYRKIQSRLIDSLKELRKTYPINIVNAGAGLHFLIEIKASKDARALEREIATMAFGRGLPLSPICEYEIDQPYSGNPVFVIDLTKINEEEIDRFSQILESILK